MWLHRPNCLGQGFAGGSEECGYTGQIAEIKVLQGGSEEWVYTGQLVWVKALQGVARSVVTPVKFAGVTALKEVAERSVIDSTVQYTGLLSNMTYLEVVKQARLPIIRVTSPHAEWLSFVAENVGSMRLLLLVPRHHHIM